MQKPKLLTSCAGDDVAVGAFVGFLTTFISLVCIFALCGRVESSSPEQYWASVWASMCVFGLSVIAVVVAEVSIFRALRRQLPEIARGYRAGCLITAGVITLASILLPTL